MTLARRLSDCLFIRWAFLQNTWVLAHAFFGIIGGNVIYAMGHWPWLITHLPWATVLRTRLLVVGIVLVGALFWDFIIEPVLERRIYGPGWRVRIYEYNARWAYDSAGDVIAAVMFAALSLYSLPSLF